MLWVSHRQPPDISSRWFATGTVPRPIGFASATSYTHIVHASCSPHNTTLTCCPAINDDMRNSFTFCRQSARVSWALSLPGSLRNARGAGRFVRALRGDPWCAFATLFERGKESTAGKSVTTTDHSPRAVGTRG